ncbi:MAG: hypothetical protein ABI082_07895 [Dokdonella sp.]
MKKLRLAGLSLALLSSAWACSSQTDPNSLKDQLTGDAKGSAAGNALCAMFSQAEVAAYVGMAVGPGQNNGGGAGCRWAYNDDEAWATVSTVPADYFPEPSGVAGFKLLPAIGDRAWVAPDSGWSAGSLEGNVGTVVVIYGKNATEVAAVSMLQEAIKRRIK